MRWDESALKSTLGLLKYDHLLHRRILSSIQHAREQYEIAEPALIVNTDTYGKDTFSQADADFFSGA